jgi:uncharacterized membrane protein
LRLFFERLPSQAVIGQLPRELLITIGLTNVAFPALLVGTIYTVIRLHRGPRAKPARIRRWDQGKARHRLKLILAAFLLAILSILPGFMLVVWYRKQLNRSMWYLLLALAITTVIMLLIINLWARLARAYRSRRRFNSWQAIALSTLLVAAAVIPASIVFGAAFPLLDVKLCATEGRYEKVRTAARPDRRYCLYR